MFPNTKTTLSKLYKKFLLLSLLIISAPMLAQEDQDEIINLDEIKSKKSFSKYFVMDIGFIINTNQYQNRVYNNRGLSLYGAGGFEISPYLATGISLGYNTYRDGDFISLHLDVRGDLLPLRATTPFYYGGIGYGILTSNMRTAAPTSRIGLFYTYGIGVKLIRHPKMYAMFSIGQQAQYIEWRIPQFSTLGPILPTFLYESIWYYRLAIKASLYIKLTQ